jgi:integrase
MPGRRDHGDGGLDQLAPDRWRLRWRIGRRRYSKVVYGTKQAAQRVLRRVITEESTRDKKVTVGSYIREWLDGDSELAPKTLERFREVLENQIGPHLGHIPLDELRPVHVKGWLDTLIKSGSVTGGPLSPASVGQARRLLHNAMERAVALEIITRNVVRPVKAPRGQKAEIEILDDSQVDNILTALAGHELYPLAAFALGTGCRRGEVCGLQWGDIDFAAAKVTIERSMEQTGAGLRIKAPKTRSGRRTIPLALSTVEMLRAHRARQSELWFALGWVGSAMAIWCSPAATADPTSQICCHSIGAGRCSRWTCRRSRTTHCAIPSPARRSRPGSTSSQSLVTLATRTPR